MAIKIVPVKGIEGVTNVKVRDAKKAANQIWIPQLNASKAYEYLDQAASAQIAGIEQGLSYYTASLDQAREEIAAGYKKANATLQPMSFAATSALNEQMRMMGMAPISASFNMASEAKDAGLSIDIQNQIKAAEKIQDPTQRAQALDKFNGMIQQANTDLGKTNEGNLAQIKQLSTLSPADAAKYSAAENLGTFTDKQKIGQDTIKALQSIGIDMSKGTTGSALGGAFGGGDVMLTTGMADSLNKQLGAIKKANEDRLSKIDEFQAQIDANNAQMGTNTAFQGNYQGTYSPTFDAGYTGSEVEARVAATPGYQFQMDQGTKAIERQGAAKGMLGSGNTLTALTQYGQGLAQNFYGMYMDNLARIVQEGSGATMQLSANQVAEGNTYGQISTQAGQAQLAAQSDIGAARASALNNKASLYMDTAKWNATQQYTGANDERNRQAGITTAAMNAAPGLAMAGVAQQKLNYGIAQNQQGGQQFYA